MNQTTSRFGTYERHEIRRPNRRWLARGIALGCAIALIVLACSLLNTDAIKLEFGDEALAVTAPDKTVTTVPYTEIRGVSLYTSPDYGTCSHGVQKSGCWYGTWRNGQWQTYRLCVHPKVNACLTVETVDGILAFNADSERSTRRLKASLDDLLSSLNS